MRNQGIVVENIRFLKMNKNIVYINSRFGLVHFLYARMFGKSAHVFCCVGDVHLPLLYMNADSVCRYKQLKCPEIAANARNIHPNENEIFSIIDTQTRRKALFEVGPRTIRAIPVHSK